MLTVKREIKQYKRRTDEEYMKLLWREVNKVKKNKENVLSCRGCEWVNVDERSREEHQEDVEV